MDHPPPDPPRYRPSPLDYARPQPRQFRVAERTSRFTLLFGFLLSSFLALAGLLSLILAVILYWSSLEVTTNGDNSSMQLGGCYALLFGVVFLIVGTGGRRVARRQLRAR